MDLTQLLLRLFVKDYRNTEDPAVRTRYGKLAGIVGIVCNVLLSAGKLLDEAGFRGKRLGGMCFSDRHANFLVNEGKGSADAALELVRSAQDAVRERFGIQLQTEVKLWVS